MTMHTSRRFELGRVVATPRAVNALSRIEIGVALLRHATCDWGDLCEEDRIANDRALESGYRLLSAYHSENGVRFWIITEADRSVTTVLLPEEY